MATIPDEFLIKWKPALHKRIVTTTSNRVATKAFSSTTASSPTSPQSPQSPVPAVTKKKICSACDACRRSRVKCGGGRVCQRCRNGALQCNYSVSMRSGRTKAKRSGEGQDDKLRPGKRDCQGLQSLAPSQLTDTSHSLDSAPNCQFSSVGTDYEACIQLPSSTNDNTYDVQPIFEDFPTLANEGQDPFASDQVADLENVDPLANQYLLEQMDLSLQQNSFPYTLDTLNGVCDALSPSLSSYISSFNLQPDLNPFSSASPTLTGSLSTASTTCNTASTGSTDDLQTIDTSFKPSCYCMTSQLHCIAGLCNPQQDLASIGLDVILQKTQETSKCISDYLSCRQCTKESTNFIFTTILFQRLVRLFCSVAKNGPAYLKALKLGVGIFELSDEDDLRHKKLLVISAAKSIDATLANLSGLVRDYQQQEPTKQKTGEMTTETGISNTNWVIASMQNLKSQLRLIVSILEAHTWGVNVRRENA